MTYFIQATFLADPAQVGRVRQALVKAAIEVMAEAANTANHNQRIAYAFYILNNAVAAGEEMAKAVATSSGITVLDAEHPSDADIEFTVNSMFNAFAGVAL